jgi:hypothetical protein
MGFINILKQNQMKIFKLVFHLSFLLVSLISLACLLAEIITEGEKGEAKEIFIVLMISSFLALLTSKHSKIDG